MGMTDSQFKAYIRLLKSNLEEAREEKDEEAKQKKLDKILENLQIALED